MAPDKRILAMPAYAVDLKKLQPPLIPTAGRDMVFRRRSGMSKYRERFTTLAARLEPYYL